jgi:phage terminase Nu1 subunit (DNA packaging protein)
MQPLAQPIIDAYVEPSAADVLDEQARRDVNEKKLQAVAVALWECIPSPKLTRAQLKARAIEIYKAL